jgi:hypothetical protein
MISPFQILDLHSLPLSPLDWGDFLVSHAIWTASTTGPYGSGNVPNRTHLCIMTTCLTIAGGGEVFYQ